MPAGATDEVAETLYLLTSCETFETLAGETRSFEDVLPLVQKLARAAVPAT